MIREEYGSYGNIRFLHPESSKMCDSDGEIVLCKCGKPAGGAIMGKEAFIAWCTDCNPNNNFSAEFIYKPPL